MKKIFSFLIVFGWFTVPVFGQDQTVPYRVGDKFGVATTEGKMIIPADYDILEPETYGDNRYYIAYKLVDGGNLSTLIYKDKIILKDQKYNNYYITNELITALQYKVITKSVYLEDRDFKLREDLYTLKGKKLFEGDFKFITIIDGLDEKKTIPSFLIYTHALNDNESLHIYDKKLKKITKTLIGNAKNIDITANYSYNYRDRSITNLYVDKNGVSKKMIIALKDNAIIVQSDTTVNLKKDTKRYNEHSSFGDVSIPVEREETKINLNFKEETILLTARKIERKRGFYYLQKKIEELSIKTINLKKDDRFIVSKDNKQGLYTFYNQQYTIPIAYDEIIFADFDGQNGGYILRNDNKYGAIIFFNKETKLIKPIFDRLVLPVNVNYFGTAKPLFKLYDEDGKLFCYADEFGKMFYKN